MIKKLDILGIELDNYTVKETITKLGELINSPGLSVVETVDMDMLQKAQHNETMYQVLQDSDLIIIGESEILSAASFKSAQRTREITEHECFREMIKLIRRNKHRVLLLGDDEEEVKHLEQYIEEIAGQLEIVGRMVLTADTEIPALLNEMNGASPDLICSAVSSPLQEEFLLGNKGMLDARLWYGMGDDYEVYSGLHKLVHYYRTFMYRRRLQTQLHKYQSKGE